MFTWPNDVLIVARKLMEQFQYILYLFHQAKESRDEA